MIQRIQSLYLLLVVLCSGVLIQWLPLFQNPEAARYVSDELVFAAGFLLSALLALLALFRYKKRQSQLVLARLNIILNFILFGALFYYWYAHLAEENSMGLGLFLPLIQVVLLVLANRGIMKDEMLVRAADRFR